MSSFYRAAILLLTVAACARPGPPRDVNNACSIIQERPSYLQAMRTSERRWGVPIAVQLATIRQESGFRRSARTPYRFFLGIIPTGRQSSAYGYSQALTTTWRDYVRDTGNYGASRSSIHDSADFIGWYMNRSYRLAGIPKWDARDQYLAYHDGVAGYRMGTYRDKGWLLRVAGRVQNNAELYQIQLSRCGVY